MPTLAGITIYPFKSLDGQAVDRVRVLSSGALEDDRRWALVDDAGQFINGKRTASIHAVRSAFDLEQLRAELEVQREAGHEVATFDLREDREELERWFSLRLHQHVRLVENTTEGFPDDTDAPGPTIISTATLETVASWFPGLSVDEVRRRFRANLEIAGVEPFWEDRLYAAPGEEVRFWIGEVAFSGVNPCQRCVVPSRDSHSGDVWPQFAKQFAQQREAHLPAWANAARFDHFYRLAVNTRLMSLSASTYIARGDSITIGENS
jgi:uncharacterized protein YcbX